MSLAAVNAVKALLSPLTVYVSQANLESGAPPYLVLHPDEGLPQDDALTAAPSRRMWTFQTTSVGTVWEMASDLASKVDVKLLNKRPVIAGYACGPIRKSVSVPIERDDDLPPGTTLFMARDVWKFETVPTS